MAQNIPHFHAKTKESWKSVALLNHVADYTTRELDSRNEIQGARELEEIKNRVNADFPMDLLRFPEYHANLSNKDILVSEFIRGFS